MRFLLLCTFLAILFAACDKEDNFITDGDARLAFSTDTLRFDTVFTELGSATRSIRVYNRNDRPVRISRIFIESGDETFFRLNVDGDPGNVAEDVVVLGNDSIWIFAEVTVDPDQPLSVSPFVVEDKIKFITNDIEQEVQLEAWGQNANYFPSRFNKGVPVVLSCDNQEVVWDDPKPYVIYGEVFIDSCLLTLPAGTDIYVHGGVARNDLFGTFNDGILYTLPHGRIHANGTKDEPVIIQGDRLEDAFQDEEGQWTGIIFGPESQDNRMSYTTVKNSIFGVYVDSAATLTMKNSQFYNTASSGIFGFHSRIDAENCLVYNNYSTAVQLLHGGDYNFTYCTIASYGVNASALAMSNFFCYTGACEEKDLGRNRLRANFRNSIIFGSRSDELILADINAGQQPLSFLVDFENCIVRVDELLEEQDGLYANFFEDICNPCLNGSREDPLFVDADADDYHLDSLSIAIGEARPILSPTPILIDLEANLRDSQSPDIGCFERQ